MVQINFALKEVNCKIVFYGPGMSGKTTNLEVIHKKAPKERKGELTSIATEGDRTLFFDFMPLDLGKVAGMNTKFQLYTVPGQVYYNSTRKLVLQGADGVIFVADSQKGKMAENIESLKNLEENLREYGMDIRTMPLVLQYNKRDLPNIMDVSMLEEKLNIYNVPSFEGVAVTGQGVFPTLKKLTSMVLESLNKQHGTGNFSVAAQRRGSRRPSSRMPGPKNKSGGTGTASPQQRPGNQQQSPSSPKPNPPKPASVPSGGQKKSPPKPPSPPGPKPASKSAPSGGGQSKSPPPPPRTAPKPKPKPKPKKRNRPSSKKASPPSRRGQKKGSKSMPQVINQPKDNTKVITYLLVALILFFLVAIGAVLFVTGMWQSLLG